MPNSLVADRLHANHRHAAGQEKHGDGKLAPAIVRECLRAMLMVRTIQFSIYIAVFWQCE